MTSNSLSIEERAIVEQLALSGWVIREEDPGGYCEQNIFYLDNRGPKLRIDQVRKLQGKGWLTAFNGGYQLSEFGRSQLPASSNEPGVLPQIAAIANDGNLAPIFRLERIQALFAASAQPPLADYCGCTINGSPVLRSRCESHGSATRASPPPVSEHPDKERLDFIEGNCVELRCKESRNHDDADVYYEAVKFYMQKPHERPVGRGVTPRAAIDEAMKNDDDQCCYCGGEGCAACSTATKGGE